MSITPHKQIRVLHVDDEPDFTDLTGTFLERESDRFAVETAATADAGMDALADRPPDCVVSDYNMPGTDGIEFLEAVRETHPDLPFILFTGRGSEQIAGEAIAAGVTDYLQKGSGSEQYGLLANRIQNAVTARRDATEATRQQHLMKRAEVLGSIGGWELRVESEDLRLTDGIKQIYGVGTDHDPSLEEVIGFYDSDDQQRVQSVIDRAIEDGYAAVDELHLRTANGEERVVEGNAELVENDDDSTLLRGVVHDITDRKQRQDELAQTHDLMSNMEELADVGAWEYDSETETLVMTDGAYRIHGLDPSADLTLAEAFESFHPDDRDLLADRFDECLETGEPYEMDVRLTTSDGEQRWITARGERVNDGASGDVVRGYVQDITEHRELEAELSEILGRISDAFFALDEELRVTHVNRRGEELLEASADELLGERLWDTYPDIEESDRMWDSLRAAMDTQTPQSRELHYEPRDDWFDVTVYPSESGVSVYFRDVTEHKEYEGSWKHRTSGSTSSPTLSATTCGTRLRSPTATSDWHRTLTRASTSRRRATRSTGVWHSSTTC